MVGELQRSSDDLKMLIARAENAADKLEGAAGRFASAGVRPHSAGHQCRDSRARKMSRASRRMPQTQALLSALGRIR